MALRPSGAGGPPFRRGSGGRGRLPSPSEEHRLNERIRVPEVRLIDHKGGQVGVVRTEKALQMAKDVGMDLMEVAPNSRPPVCKIVDYGKFKYEKKKKEHVAKKKQTVIKVKEIQLRPNTDTHDLGYKLKNARTFLEEGDKAKLSMRFRGREMVNRDVGLKTMLKLAEGLKDVSTIETHPKMEGRKLFMILAPVAKKVKKEAAAKPDKEAAEEQK